MSTRSHCLGALFAFVLSAGLAAQSRNVTLLGHFDPGTKGGLHNDVWAWRNTKTQREVAILGSTSGFWVVETTDPTKPVQRGYFPSAPQWRPHVNMDIKIRKGYAYVVTEGGAGLEIIDLRDVGNPKFVKFWGTQYWQHCHNMGIDRDNGWLVIGGTGNSNGETVRFVDVDTDPVNPRLIASWSAPYVHDSVLQDGLLHTAEIYTGYYGIYDVSALPIVKKLGSIQTPRLFTHNVWPSRDSTIAVTTDENWLGGWMNVYDITNRAAPKWLSQYKTGPSGSIVHNAILSDYVAHVSYYTEGYRCIDLSDPKNPVEVGFYDTNASTTRFDGAWGVYPFQDSGIVYVSDRNNGLYILKPRATPILYGTGTPGTGGKLPEIRPTGTPYLGNQHYALGVHNAVAQSVAILVVGAKSANISSNGLWFHVYLVPAPYVVGGPTGASGELDLPLPIPNQPSLDKVRLFAQFFVLDASGKLGMSASKGLELELFPK